MASVSWDFPVPERQEIVHRGWQGCCFLGEGIESAVRASGWGAPDHCFAGAVAILSSGLWDIWHLKENKFVKVSPDVVSDGDSDGGRVDNREAQY